MSPAKHQAPQNSMLATPLIGKTLGPFEIVAQLGAGGMGEVWKARDTRPGRIVALKTAEELHSERFKQEARSIATLNHPNICRLHYLGEPPGCCLNCVNFERGLGSI